MSETTTLALDGLFTRFGSKLRNFQGFGHERDEDNGQWIWYFVADLYGTENDGREYELPSRKVFMDHVCYDPTDPDDGETGRRNMQALADACMEHLKEHGEWTERGHWRAVA